MGTAITLANLLVHAYRLPDTLGKLDLGEYLTQERGLSEWPIAKGFLLGIKDVDRAAPPRNSLHGD